jgi:hypothetical protein
VTTVLQDPGPTPKRAASTLYKGNSPEVREDRGNGADSDFVEHVIQNIFSPHRILELNCLILGQDPKHIFSVKITKTESISTLKEVIKGKKKNAFRHIDADTLIVWQVSVLGDSSLGQNLEELSLSEESSLGPMQNLSELFSEPPIHKHLHILVQPPPVIQTSLHSEPLQLLELNCLIIGDSCNNIFTVKIAKTESISALKEVIKEKKKNAFEHVDADTLIVWQVSILGDISFEQNLGEINLSDESSLGPMQKLSRLFSEPPIQTHLHIVVKPEPARESK